MSVFLSRLIDPFCTEFEVFTRNVLEFLRSRSYNEFLDEYVYYPRT